MEIRINKDIEIEPISIDKYNVKQINKVKKEYGVLRQESKTPT